MPKIPVIDPEDCIACGTCEQLCPGVFRVNEALEHSEVIDPHGAPADKIQDAIDECPVHCIRWHVASSGEG